MASPLEWSAAMDGLFWNCVVRVVLDDPRTDWSENLSLGYPFEVIRKQVLAKGLADFSQGHVDAKFGHLTPDEKALLYCFVNFKKHFFAAYATFEEHRAIIEELLVPEENPFVLDIGCGPATACLALMDLLPGKTFHYVGIDSAAAMRTKAAAFWDAAKKNGLAGATSTAAFLESWTDLTVGEVSPERSVLVVLSYCCASHTLTLPALKALAHTILTLIEGRTRKPLVLVYTNSTNPLSSVKFDILKQEIGLDPEAAAPASITIEYRKKRGGAALSSEEFVRQVLRIKKRS
jgi:hypothetical protein